MQYLDFYEITGLSDMRLNGWTGTSGILNEFGDYRIADPGGNICTGWTRLTRSHS